MQINSKQPIRMTIQTKTRVEDLGTKIKQTQMKESKRAKATWFFACLVVIKLKILHIKILFTK